MKVLVITVEGDNKYTFGIDKKVSDVLVDIDECKSEFFQVVDSCAIRKNKIISVESVEYTPKEGDNND